MFFRDMKRKTGGAAVETYVVETMTRLRIESEECLGLDAEPRHSLHDVGLERRTTRFALQVSEELRLHLR